MSTNSVQDQLFIEAAASLSAIATHAHLDLLTLVERFSDAPSAAFTHGLDWLTHQLTREILLEFNYRWLYALPYDEPWLYPGAEGPAIAAARQLLHLHRYLPTITMDGTQDISFDAPMRIALVTFQRHWGLKADGILGPRTWRSLRQPIKQMDLATRLSTYRSAADCPVQHAKMRSALAWLQEQLSAERYAEFLMRCQ